MPILTLGIGLLDRRGGRGGTVAEQNWAGGSTAPGRGRVSPLLKVLPAFAEGFNPLQIYDGNKMLSSRHFQRKH